MENNPNQSPAPPILLNQQPAAPEQHDIMKEFANAVTNPGTATGYNAIDITIFVLSSIGLAWMVGLMGFAVVPMYLFQGIGVLVTGVLGMITLFLLANVNSYNSYSISYTAFALGNAVGGLIAFTVVATAIRMGMAHRNMQHHHVEHHHHHKKRSSTKHRRSRSSSRY